jgi:hypothetical protein
LLHCNNADFAGAAKDEAIEAIAIRREPQGWVALSGCNTLRMTPRRTRPAGWPGVHRAQSHHTAATQATRRNRDFSANTAEVGGLIVIGEQFVMLSAHENKPTGKSGQRARKKKAGQQTKADEQHTAATDQLRDTAAEISQEMGLETGQETVQETSQETGQEIDQETGGDTSAQVSIETLPATAGATEITASEPMAAVELVPVSVQAIADAYRDYTATSLEHAFAFFGKLAAARSPAEAFEIQMQFAKEACEAFVAGSQKIADLQGQLARQRVMHLEGFAARITQTTFELRATRH